MHEFHGVRLARDLHVGAQLKQRYEQLERAKKSRQLVSLDTAEVPKKEKRKAEAAGSAGGSLRAKLG